MNEVERLQEQLREATFTMREVAATLESERADWERRVRDAFDASLGVGSERRIEQLQGELAYQRDKLRDHAKAIEKLLGEEA